MAWGMANPERYAERDETYANQGFQKILQKLAEEGIIQVMEGHPKEYSNYFKGENGFFYAVRKLWCRSYSNYTPNLLKKFESNWIKIKKLLMEILSCLVWFFWYRSRGVSR